MEGKAVEKPHAVLVPFPAQGHINPLLQLAKLLHFRGFYITFVNTKFNHQRLLRSQGPNSLEGLEDFRFETIPDGLPLSNLDATQDIAALCESTTKHCLVPFRDLLTKLNNSPTVPPVTCVVADGVMSFALQAAEEFGILVLVFYTMSACGCMGYLQMGQLKESGYTPLKDESCLVNGYLDTPINWIPGMNNIRLRDLPSFIRTTDPDDFMLKFEIEQAHDASRGWGLILNTFVEFEHEVLEAIKCKFPRLYTLGPLFKLCNQLPEGGLKFTGFNLWKEDTNCLEWLDKRKADSVVYVNFGSITVMSAHQLIEFAWGLANSKQFFLWTIRPDLVMGDSATLPEEFMKAAHERCFITSWCPQEKVLSHPSTGGFLTHCGWNSTLESICGGVPIIGWPFFAEQQTNCRYACTKWGIGMEIDNNVKREEVEVLVREMMEGEKGNEMRKKAMEWKESADRATKQGGSSYANLEKLVKDVLMEKHPTLNHSHDSGTPTSIELI